MIPFGCSNSKIESEVPVSIKCNLPGILSGALSLDALVAMLGLALIQALMISGLWEVCSSAGR